MTQLTSYPEVVDAVWRIVRGEPPDNERTAFHRTEQEVAQALGLDWSWGDDACVFGIAQALSDLVDLGYCVGRGTYNGLRYTAVSPSHDAPDAPPSAFVLGQGLARLPGLRARALRFIHERTVRHERGITFYAGVQILFPEATQALLPDVADSFAATGDVVEAVKSLKGRGYIKGPITAGAFHLSVTFKGACWLLTGAALLELVDRAAKLREHPEALEAARIVVEAHTRSEQDAARDVTVAIEKLENAVGGERKLAEYLGRPKAYVGDLKQSAQVHRHADTRGRVVLDHTQRLARAKEIVELYLVEASQRGLGGAHPGGD
jgi:hypothetical protein